MQVWVRYVVFDPTRTDTRMLLLFILGLPWWRHLGVFVEPCHLYTNDHIPESKTVSGGDPRQEANHWLLKASTSRITGLAEVALNHSDVLWVHLFMQCHSALLYCILDTLPKFQEHEKKSMKDMVSAPGGLMCHWLWYQAKSCSEHCRARRRSGRRNYISRRLTMRHTEYTYLCYIQNCHRPPIICCAS